MLSTCVGELAVTSTVQISSASKWCTSDVASKVARLPCNLLDTVGTQRWVTYGFRENLVCQRWLWRHVAHSPNCVVLSANKTLLRKSIYTIPYPRLNIFFSSDTRQRRFNECSPWNVRQVYRRWLINAQLPPHNSLKTFSSSSHRNISRITPVEKLSRDSAATRDWLG